MNFCMSELSLQKSWQLQMECIFVLDSNTVGEKGWQPELPRPRKFGKQLTNFQPPKFRGIFLGLPEANFPTFYPNSEEFGPKMV